MGTEEDNKILAPSSEDILTETERIGLAAYRKQGSQMRLSADTQLRLYALFLAGHSCQEIQGLNKAFSLGQILTARLEGKWDQRRTEYLDSLFTTVRSRVQQATLESIGFITDQLAAVHKHYGEKAKRYLQSGDIKDFDGFGAEDIKGYKVLIESLQKITGTEKSPSEVNVTLPAGKGERDVNPEKRPMSSGQAAEIVRMANLLKKGNKNNG